MSVKVLLKNVVLTVNAFFLFKLLQFAVRWARMRNQMKMLAKYYPVIESTTSLGGNIKLQKATLVDAIKASVDTMNFGRRSDGTFFSKTVVRGGPIVAPSPSLCTVDPVIMKHVFKNNFKYYERPSYFRQAFKGALGHGLAASQHSANSPEQGKQWKSRRHIMARIFTNNVFETTIKEQFEITFRRLTEQISSIQQQYPNKPIPMKEKLFTVSQEVMFYMSVGEDMKDLSPQDYKKLSVAVQDTLPNLFKRITSPYWEILGRFYKAERKVHRYLKDAFSIFESRIENRRNDPNWKTQKDFLTILLEAEAHKPTKVLSSKLVGLMIAGISNLGSYLTFTLYLLGSHPEIQEKLFEELKQIDLEADISQVSAQLKALPFLEGVAMEALRLFPLAPANAKVAVQDDILPDGTPIPAGTMILVQIAAMFRDESVYKNANDFIPERWIKPGRKVGSFDDYAFPVFGIPNRSCLGRDFSFFELKSFLLKFVQMYRFRYVPEDKPVYVSTPLFQFVGDLNLTIEHRIK